MDRSAFSKLLVVVGVIWLGYWLYLGRYHQLDDAFIGLKYARNLRTYGFLTYDAVHPNDGTSTPLFIFLLSRMPGLMTTIHSAKALSVAGYLGLLMLLLWLRRDQPEANKTLWSLFVIVLVSPMAFRWLTDGMETSFVVLFSALLAAVAYATSGRPHLSPLRYLLFLALGWAVVTLRIELSVLVLTGSLGAWVLSVEGRGVAGGFRPRLWSFLQVAVRESHLAIGGLSGVATIYFVTGYILSDSAVAKASGPLQIGQLWNVVRAFVASFSLGVGLLALWMVCFTALLGAAEVRKYHCGSLLLINCSLLIPVLGAVVRGQGVQGVRYFLGPMVFMIVWNLLMIPPGLPVPNLIRDYFHLGKTRGQAVLVAALTVLAIAWLLEGSVVSRIFRDRSSLMLAMRSQHLEILANKPGVASDIGMISVFSEGNICDLCGLVNGRQSAEESKEQRAVNCARQSPVFAYLNPGQAAFFGRYMNLDSWYVWHEYWISNVAVHEIHYLLVRPDIAGMIPQAAHFPTYGTVRIGNAQN